MITQQVKIIECPRDAWQAMPQHIPAEAKADYLRALIAAGFRHIDAVSFVSPSAVPQMADSERVLALLDPASEVEIIGIVVNQQGAERAIRSGAVRTLGFPYSLSATFLERNQRQTLEQARHALKEICQQAERAGLGVVAYLSMAFGNPYGDLWRPEDVVAACQTLKDLGLKEISLADTVGLASPGQIESLLRAVLKQFQESSSAPTCTPALSRRQKRWLRLTRRAAAAWTWHGWTRRLPLRSGRAGGRC